MSCFRAGSIRDLGIYGGSKVQCRVLVSYELAQVMGIWRAVAIALVISSLPGCGREERGPAAQGKFRLPVRMSCPDHLGVEMRLAVVKRNPVDGSSRSFAQCPVDGRIYRWMDGPWGVPGPEDDEIVASIRHPMDDPQ